MTKKALLIAGISIAMMIALFLGSSIIQKITKKKTIQSKIQILPSANFLNLDSAVFAFPSTGLGIVYFNSGCEHCQYELNEFKKHKALFAKKELFLLSSENISVIKKFAEQIGLSNEPNFHFTKINSVDVFETFGSLSVPHIFVYGNDHRLIKEFKGETKVETIAKCLP